MQTLARKLFPAHDWPKVHGSQEPEKKHQKEKNAVNSIIYPKILLKCSTSLIR
jgi:hypothetical protein